MPTLSEDIEALRAIPGKWKERPDPLGDLAKLRAGEDIDLIGLPSTDEEIEQFRRDCYAAIGQPLPEDSKYVPTIEEMSGLVPDMTEGLSLKEYMELISNE